MAKKRKKIKTANSKIPKSQHQKELNNLNPTKTRGWKKGEGISGASICTMPQCIGDLFPSLFPLSGNFVESWLLRSKLTTLRLKHVKSL